MGLFCFPSLCLCSRSFPRKFEAGQQPRSHLLQREKLIKLMIQGSFIQNLPFLLEALIKTIADQSAAKHLIGDGAFCSHPFEVSGSSWQQQRPGPGRVPLCPRAAPGTLHKGTGVTLPIPAPGKSSPRSVPGSRSSARELSPLRRPRARP